MWTAKTTSGCNLAYGSLERWHHTENNGRSYPAEERGGGERRLFFNTMLSST